MSVSERSGYRIGSTRGEASDGGLASGHSLIRRSPEAQTRVFSFFGVASCATSPAPHHVTTQTRSCRQTPVKRVTRVPAWPRDERDITGRADGFLRGMQFLAVNARSSEVHQQDLTITCSLGEEGTLYVVRWGACPPTRRAC